MDEEKDNISPYSGDYDINVRILAFSVVTIVLILVVIFFIKTYAGQKQKVLKLLASESSLLETYCRDTFDNNRYVLNLLTHRIKSASGNLEHVTQIFKQYTSSGDIHNLFGWKEFIWIDENFVPRISSKDGALIGRTPIDAQYTRFSKKEPGRPLYGRDLSRKDGSKPLIYTVVGVKDEFGKYLGTLLVKYDMDVLSSQLKRHKKHNYTNFVLIDRLYKVVAQSQPTIESLGIEPSRIVNKNTDELIKSIDLKSTDKIEISYLDMVNGVNYFIKKIEGEPFILLVNIDHDEIRNRIFHSVIMKFFEISIFAAFVLVIVVSIYRRETWLRSKAEAASKMALKATNAKSEFLAFTAHEVRSPLGFIMTGSEIMTQEALGPLPEVYKSYAEGIHNNASSILEFITDILDEENVLHGNFKIVNTLNRIEQIIEIATINNRVRYSSRNIAINHEIQDNLPSLVCDGRRILQVISNLISNAIKYSHNNTTITIRAYLENSMLLVEIEDQGIGMKHDDIKIAFTKYGTVRREHMKFIDSYGLGLPIVKLLLDAHNASIDVTSELNVGTKVKISFPKYKLVYGKNNAESQNTDLNTKQLKRYG